MMTFDELASCLASYRGTEPGYPFGPDVQVWKVGGKMFALLAEDADPPRIPLERDPDLVLERRAEYPHQVAPGFHLDKRHWGTITIDDRSPPVELEDWIGHSYGLVVAGLPTRVRESLG